MLEANRLAVQKKLESAGLSDYPFRDVKCLLIRALARMPPSLAVHASLQALLNGRRPTWTVANDQRLEHMERVARLLDAWAVGLGLSEREVLRWRAAGLAHDLLRDADKTSCGATCRRRWLLSPVRFCTARLLPNDCESRVWKTVNY